MEQYNAYSSTEFCNAGFDILDYYPITDAYPEGTGTKKTPHDPVHYEYHVMQPMERLLERVFQIVDWDHLVEFCWNVLIESNVMPGEPMEGLLEYVLIDCTTSTVIGKENIMWFFSRKDIWKFLPLWERPEWFIYKYFYYIGYIKNISKKYDYYSKWRCLSAPMRPSHFKIPSMIFDYND